MRNSTKANCNRSLLTPLFMVCLLMQSSCLPDPLEITQIPLLKPEIVVASQILPDKSLVVLLTRTFGALEANINSDPEGLLEKIAVNDALVTIHGNNTVDTLVFLDNGFYGGVDIPFQAGVTYKLHVDSEMLGEVYAYATVQPQVSFKDIEAGLSFNEFGDTITQVTYAFYDHPGVANWYMLNVQKIEQGKLIEKAINPKVYTRLLEDTTFNGQLYLEKVSVIAKDFKSGDTIAVLLSNISEAYYEFVKLRIDTRNSFMEFLGSPINYPSNVTGGKGFFNLYIPDIRTFVFEED